MPTTAPVKPVGTPTKITVSEGQSLSVLAAKYNTTIELIKKTNNLKSDAIKPGQTLTINVITNEELKKYEELKAQYDASVQKEQEEKEIAARTEKAQGLIDKAKKDGYREDYDFTINDKGHIVIKLKNPKKLSEISEDFGLAPGTLRNTNPSIEQKYKPQTKYREDGTPYETYDTCEAEADATFVIDTNDFKTERTWSQAFKDEVLKPLGNAFKKYTPEWLQKKVMN